MRNKGLIIFGSVLAGFGVCIIILSRYFDLKSASAVLQATKDATVNFVTTITSDRKSNITSTGDNNLGYSVAIDALSDDQVLTSVTDYKNVIEIPSLNIAAVINEGTDYEALHAGVGHFTGTANVGGIGNFAICGHASSTYKCIFNNLSEISVFDTIDAYDADGNKFTYTVTEVNVIQPYDWSRVQETGSNDEQLLTIITCYDNGQRRLVVRGKIIDEDKVAEMKQTLIDMNMETALKYSNNIRVSNLYNYFTRPNTLPVKQYNLDKLGVLNINSKSVRASYLSPVLLGNADVKKHRYAYGFSLDFGFDIPVKEIIPTERKPAYGVSELSYQEKGLSHYQWATPHIITPRGVSEICVAYDDVKIRHKIQLNKPNKIKEVYIQ